MKRSYSLAELAQHVEAQVIGEPQYLISALASLQNATANDLSFIANPAYKKYLATSGAGAVLIRPDMADEFPGNKLLIANPYLAYARLSELFKYTNQVVMGVHPTAVVGQDCILGENVSVGPNVVLGDGVELADGVVVGAGSYVGDHSCIGAHTRLAANVSIYHGVSIGSHCLLHSGCVIGADGFGFAPHAGQWVKIQQLGGVVIGNHVEIGAATCIDRGALGDTILNDGVIIDNLVQIAHNVVIGKNTAIAAHTAIAGSTTIGDNCTIAGAVGIAGHLNIASGVHVTAMSMVSSTIREPGSYSSGIALSPTKEWRKNAVHFRHLDTFASRLKNLEKKSTD